MSRRKIMLYGALLGIVVLYSGDAGYRHWIEQPAADRERRIERLARQLDEESLQLAISQRTANRLERLEERSLPRDLELARSSYQAWLLELVEAAGIEEPRVDAGAPAARSNRRRTLYHSIGFSVRGRGDLAQVTRLLYDFYSAGHLHKVAGLRLSPMGADRLDVDLAIEALVLPSADREDRLSPMASERLVGSSLGDYQTIVERNVFSLDGETTGSDVILSAITTNVRGNDEAWFHDRRQGTTLQCREGDALPVGLLSARVLAIEQNAVLLRLNGQSIRVNIGERLSDGQQPASDRLTHQPPTS